MRWPATAALVLALAGCMVPQSYGQWRGAQGEAFTVAEVRADPAAFLAAHAGQTVQVEGYLEVDQLDAGARNPANGTLHCEGTAGREQRIMLPDLTYNRTVYPQALRHRVVVEATASPPRDLALGGGDLTLQLAADQMVLVLDNARLVAVDWSGAACDPSPLPAP